jgi:hypothetical protein
MSAIFSARYCCHMHDLPNISTGVISSRKSTEISRIFSITHPEGASSFGWLFEAVVLCACAREGYNIIPFDARKSLMQTPYPRSAPHPCAFMLHQTPYPASDQSRLSDLNTKGRLIGCLSLTTSIYVRTSSGITRYPSGILQFTSDLGTNLSVALICSHGHGGNEEVRRECL